MPMLVKITAAGAVTAQTTRLVELPDIPGRVVQVWAVHFDLQSFSATTAVVHALSHDVNLGTTLSSNDVAGQWLHAEQSHDTDGPGQGHIVVPFWPEPYELVGTQRWDIVPSAGTIIPFMTVHYTIRTERNRTNWNLLRARTSFERD